MSGTNQEPLKDSSGREVHIAIDRSHVLAQRMVPPCPYEFPDPRTARTPETIVAHGGDFMPATVLAAYRMGLFPWPHEEVEYVWFSPEPRAILPIDGIHISRRLARTIRSGCFRVTVDVAFETVMEACAVRPDDGTWITPALIEGYVGLNRAGYAHSIEVWEEATGELAGGLYGVAAGAMFGAESMFHQVRDASKVAMVALVQLARQLGIELIDVQVVTDHTRRMGVVEIPRREYLRRLDAALERDVSWIG